MRAASFPIVVLLSAIAPPPALAQYEQEGGTLDIGGGVEVPVPAEDRVTPDLLAPPSGPDLGERSSSVERTQGHEAGRTVIGEDGEEVRVWQTSRVSGVQTSDRREQYDWFYDAVDVYAGVIPHLRDSLPHLARIQSRGAVSGQPNEVTWIGFQPLPEYTRVFIQLARTPQYRADELEEGRVVSIVLSNTRLSLSNWTRFVDTSFFDRSVELIDAERDDGGNARLVIVRDELAPYDISVDGNYLFVDFRDVGPR